MPVRHSSSQPRQLRILLVDDNRTGLRARKSVLEELGHSVVTASSAQEGLDEFSHHPFDLVVTDYKMPHMDGLELIARLRKQNPTLAVVLLSGFADIMGLNERNTGADAVIQKSANEVSHLVRAIAQLGRRSPPKKPATGESAPQKSKRKSV